MGISLAKGQKIDLTKTNPGLTKVVVGLGWDVNKYDGGHDFDLDASVFLLDAAGKQTLHLILSFTIKQLAVAEVSYIQAITVQVKEMEMMSRSMLIFQLYQRVLRKSPS